MNKPVSQVYTGFVNYFKVLAEKTLEPCGNLYVASHVQKPLFNGVFSFNLSPDDYAATHEQLIQHSRARGLDACWWVSSEFLTPSLKLFLQMHKYKVQRDFNMMYCDINPQSSQTLGLNADQEIRAIESPDELLQWGQVVQQAFALADETIGQIVAAYQPLLQTQATTVQHYCIRQAGQAIASATFLRCDEGIGGLYNMAVHPQYQRQGLGIVLLQHCINLAVASQCHCLVAQTVDASTKLVAQQGMQRCGTIDAYVLAL